MVLPDNQEMQGKMQIQVLLDSLDLLESLDSLEALLQDLQDLLGQMELQDSLDPMSQVQQVQQVLQDRLDPQGLLDPWETLDRMVLDLDLSIWVRGVQD
jgi:hypothetical protein